ncbi:hypothetical protein, partial [Paraburkholderia caribensis]|uniref:hypothetical protein n=1 Tax=Paraburkholderia caribensis TaxID=75105 RepID=UPI00209178C8
AKKSRCRPAQGRRLKHANNSRMPAKAKANRECQREVKYTKLQRLRHAGNSRIPPQTTEPNQTAGRAGKKKAKKAKKKAKKTRPRPGKRYAV